MKFIGFGGWVYYYYFLLAATLTKVLKEDIFGFGKSFQILNDLRISKHKFLILFLNYFSEFFFGLIINLGLYYLEKKDIKRKMKYEKMENNDITDINKSHNDKKKKKKSKQEMELISKEKDIDTVASVMNGNNLINDERISAHLTLLISKKSEEIDNKLDTTDNSHTVPKNYELIHNNIFEDITDSSINSMILSCFLLIVNDVVIKWIFSTNEMFDYFFFNILIMTLIYKYHYKEKIYKHQTLALIIILFIAGALFIACLFETINIYDQDKTVWEAFNDNYYMVFIFIIIYFASSTFSCYGIIIQKRIMDYKFASPYKIILYRGVMGMIITAILVIITTCVPCTEYNNLIDSSNSNENSTDQSNTAPPLFECVDNYTGNTYFDNGLSYFNELFTLEDKKDKYLEIFLSIPLFCVLNFITNILIILVNKFMSPFHCLIVDSLYRLIHIPIQTIQDIKLDNKNLNGYFYEYILQPTTNRVLRIIAYFISLIGYFIYLEIIELKFCGLNENIIKNIRKRAKIDGNVREASSNFSTSSSNFSNEEEEEKSEKNI